ncbi:MAG: maleylpyruvate isomerase family mycothiol-dependent enzyme, partial [Acidimicrobiia bacterium]|nr:maleylpyruvate isomerase family mycothiol-dependent enzyme [Acidimicrobiia bacterium]
MEDVVAALLDQLAELESIVAGLDGDRWATPSACPGWTVRHVLVHLAQTNEAAIASVGGGREAVAAMWSTTTSGRTVDDIAAAAVEGNDLDGPEVHAWWKRTADEMVAAFEACDPRARVPWVVGEMAARTLCTTRLAETWIHTTDVAVGLDVELAPTDRLWHIARLVQRTLPYAFEREGLEPPGPVRFELAPPGGE